MAGTGITGFNRMPQASVTAKVSTPQPAKGGAEPKAPLPSFAQGFLKIPLKGMKIAPGQVIWGKVIGQKGNLFQLQFGRFIFNTRTNFPLTLGQSIQLKFTGNVKGGYGQFQIVGSFKSSPINASDLSMLLTNMNLPANEQTLNIAQAMVEFKIPLTGKNVTEFMKVLTSLPRPMNSADLAAVSFLKMANIPITTNNVMVLSNFISQNPILGAQLVQIQMEAGGILKEIKTKQKREVEVLEELTEITEKHTIHPQRQSSQKISKNLYNMAKEEGIEGIKHGFGGANMEEGWELMKLLREAKGMFREDTEAYAKLKGLISSLEENIQAHQIINKNNLMGDNAFFYLQVPMKMGEDITTANIKIQYHNQDEKERAVDPENTRIEFDVETEYLGQVHVDLKVTNGTVNVDMGFECGHVEPFLEELVPIFKENITKAGYTLGGLQILNIEDFERKPLIEKENIEVMEKIDVHV